MSAAPQTISVGAVIEPSGLGQVEAGGVVNMAVVRRWCPGTMAAAVRVPRASASGQYPPLPQPAANRSSRPCRLLPGT